MTRVNQQVLNFHTYRGQEIAANKFDTKSIMMYPVPTEILQAGSAPIPQNNVLSDGDKEWVARLYSKDSEERPGFEPEEIIPDP